MSESGAETALRLVISGRVQGVWFRAFTRQRALELGLVGWVRNLPDGNVEAQVAGPTPALEALVRQLRIGPPGSRVDSVAQERLAAPGDWSSFQILY